MEENNRKGPGVFYAVVGVATLVVAIIGATFAYFSAAAAATGDDVTGGTNNDLASALSVTVTRVNKTPETGVASINLVPANIDGTLTTVDNAVKAKCAANGYTGCHLYKIEAQSTQTVANASILLNTLTVDAKVKTNWHYAIYTGTETSATAIVSTGNLDLATPDDMHKNASLTANTPVTYYLLVYLTNTDSSQNEAGDTSETGTYTGTVTMNAAGGQVSATFSA